ncbi:phage baseplate assembly protein domain-containing protein [Sodalis sp. (in: enterobacteria)]|uniref:phage baseplate assembly protein domain-containing protein n=1 Tax=Sodalis sp. (in: enterobacteria) TaxID=1898979 RepID=UPI003F38082E
MLNTLKVRLFSLQSDRFCVAKVLTKCRLGFDHFFYANHLFWDLYRFYFVGDLLMKNAVAMLQRVLSRLWSRAVVRGVNSTLACQQVDISLVAGETKNGMEHLNSCAE